MKDVKTGRIDENHIGEKQVTAYANQWSIERGEDIDFMVNCDGPDTYRADVVKLICGDLAPEGPGYEERIVETDLNGEFDGTAQEINAGSHVIVPDAEPLRATGDFTIAAIIYPTTPQRGKQGILAKQSPDSGGDYALLIDDGRLTLRLSGADETVSHATVAKPLQDSLWYFVAASYDAKSGTARVYQQPLPDSEHKQLEVGTDHATAVEVTVPFDDLKTSESPLVMAGLAADDANDPVVTDHYNGKIESPVIVDRALNREEIEPLLSDPTGDDDVVAAWDFSEEITEEGIRQPDRITDMGPNELHGRAVQLPARAIPGHNWDGTVQDFTQAPEQYGAIHFHEDDMVDAGWEVAFTFSVPSDFESAVYAIRLRTDADEYHVPFYVRPPVGENSADIAFLAPTNSYLAYGNEHFATDTGILSLENHWGSVPIMDERALHLSANREIGLSLYDTHPDGHGSMFSSRLRPIMNMGPKAITGGGPPSHLHQFNADLYVVDWLERKGYEYDVLTDEDLHEHGVNLLEPYNVVITGHHPEYYTGEQLDAITTYQQRGGRFTYLGGNGFYWVIAYHPDNPQIIETRRGEAGTEAWVPKPGELYHAFTGEKGGLWRKRGRAPQTVAGVGFSAQWDPQGTYYRRHSDSYKPETAFIFDGIDDERIGDFGLLGGGTAGEEVDRYDTELGSPEHAYVLASSEGHTEYERQVSEEIPIMDAHLDARMNPRARSDIVFYETTNGGAVFSVGSMAWVGGLSHDEYDNPMSRMLANVVDAFSADDPLPTDGNE